MECFHRVVIRAFTFVKLSSINYLTHLISWNKVKKTRREVFFGVIGLVLTAAFLLWQTRCLYQGVPIPSSKFTFPWNYHYGPQCPGNNISAVIYKPDKGLGLGNQLFRYACSYALSRKLNLPMYLYCSGELSKCSEQLTASSTEEHLPTNPLLRLFLLPYFNITFTPLSIDSCPSERIFKFKDDLLIKFLNRSTVPSSEVQTNTHAEPEAPPFPSNKFLIHDDYCQSEEFFREFKNEVLQQFSMKNWKAARVRKTLDHIQSSGENSIGIHIRRGDYVHPDRVQYQWDTPIQFYVDAVKLMMDKLNAIGDAKNITLFLFSDDPQWLQEHFNSLIDQIFSKRVTRIRSVLVSGRGYSSLEEFYLMTQCGHLIISNSTFSWWAAYLSLNRKDDKTGKRKIVICPKFSPQFFLHYKGLEEREFKWWIINGFYYPKEWIMMDPYRNSTYSGVKVK